MHFVRDDKLEKPVREVENGAGVELLWRVVRKGLPDKMTLNIDLNEVSKQIL